jgi:flagellar export protein FliJ
MLKARECWPVLAKKAEDGVRQWRTEIASSQARLQQLQVNLERLDRMYQEYRSGQLKPQKTGLGMHAHLNQRQFMSQLLLLQHKVQNDIAQAQSVLAQQRKQLLLAELEHQKMLALVEQDQRAVQKDALKRDQRRMDDLGIARFNLGPGL